MRNSPRMKKRSQVSHKLKEMTKMRAVRRKRKMIRSYWSLLIQWSVGSIGF